MTLNVWRIGRHCTTLPIKCAVSLGVFLVAYVAQEHAWNLDRVLTHSWLYAHTPAPFERLDEWLRHVPSTAVFLVGRAGVALVLATGVHLIGPVARYLRSCRQVARATGDVGLNTAALQRSGIVVLLSLAISITLFCAVDVLIRPAYEDWLPDPIAVERAWIACEPEWIRSRAWLENDTTTCVVLAPIYAIPLAISCIPVFVAPMFLRPHRDANVLCIHCGYNVLGNPMGICPECGKPSRPSD